MSNEVKNIGVFVGRVCPIHIGHMKIIDKMIEDFGEENCVIFIGSSTNKISYRVLFDYADRSRWMKRIYKNVRIIGLPDAPDSNKLWMNMLIDYLESIFWNHDVVVPIFYSGSETDVSVQKEYGYDTIIIDRKELNVSATEVREKLFYNSDIKDLVSAKIIHEVKSKFSKNIKLLDSIIS